MTHPRRKFRLYAPFEQIPDSKTGNSRYQRLTYTVYDVGGNKVAKSFPGQTLTAAVKRYEQILVWGIWGSHKYRNPLDRRRKSNIILRPVPASEQPKP